MSKMDDFTRRLSDPREMLAAYLTGYVCGQCKCSNRAGYADPEMRQNCECYKAAGEILDLLKRDDPD